MFWLGLLKTFLGLASTVAGMIERRNLMNAGEVRVILKALEVSNVKISSAIHARRKAEQSPLDADNDGMLDDDGFGE